MLTVVEVVECLVAYILRLCSQRKTITKDIPRIPTYSDFDTTGTMQGLNRVYLPRPAFTNAVINHNFTSETDYSDHGGTYTSVIDINERYKPLNLYWYHNVHNKSHILIFHLSWRIINLTNLLNTYGELRYFISETIVFGNDGCNPLRHVINILS